MGLVTLKSRSVVGCYGDLARVWTLETGSVRKMARCPVRTNYFVAALGPALFVLSLVALTVYQRAYLRSVGWSPVGRTEVQWPSIMANGPEGWVLGVLLLAAGVGLMLLAVAGWERAESLRTKWTVGCVAVLGAALLVLVSPADAPSAGTTGWGRLHDSVYPVVPTASLLGMLLSTRIRTGRPDRLVLTGVVAVAFLSSGVDPVAQLARYAAFLGVAVWVTTTARELLSGTTETPPNQFA